MWSELRDWVVPLIAFGSFAWSAWMALRKNVVRPQDLAKFATTVDLVGTHKVLQDQIDEADRANVNARHEIEMLKKDVENLPTHKQVQELRDNIGELKTGQAENSTKLDGMDDKLDTLRATVGRMDDFLRTKI